MKKVIMGMILGAGIANVLRDWKEEWMDDNSCMAIERVLAELKRERNSARI